MINFSVEYIEFKILMKYSDILYMAGCMCQGHMKENWTVDADLRVCIHLLIHSLNQHLTKYLS